MGGQSERGQREVSNMEPILLVSISTFKLASALIIANYMPSVPYCGEFKGESGPLKTDR